MTQLSLLDSPLLIASAVITLSSLLFSIKIISVRRPNASQLHKASLFVLHLLVFGCFLGLIIQPQYSTSESNNLRLFTDFEIGKPPELLSNDYLLIRSKKQFTRLSENYRLKNRSKIILAPDQLFIKEPTLNTLEVIGDGLSESELAKFHDVNLIYRAPTTMPSVVNPRWPTKIYIGDDLKIVAEFSSQNSSIYRVELISPADLVSDTKSVTSDEYFELSTRPKIQGAHQYKLRVFDRQDKLIQEELIPVTVADTPSSRILILQSSPSFETKQLQNWAAEYGASVVSKTKISRDIYTTRTINRPSNNSNNEKVNSKLISEDELKYFDLLIIDGRELLHLSETELVSLQKATDAGLGILILADQDLVNANRSSLPAFINSFQLSAIDSDTQVEINLLFENLESFALSDSVVDLSASPLSRYQSSDASHSSLVTTTDRLALVSSLKLGVGRVAISVLKETFRLATSDQKESYTRLWQHIISNIARQTIREQYTLNDTTSLVFKNQLANLCVLSLRQVTDLSVNTDINRKDKHHVQSIKLQPDPLIPNQYCGFFWPRSSGWQTLSLKDAEAEEVIIFFVSSSDSWMVHRQLKKIAATTQKASRDVETKSKHLSMKRFNDWYFWGLLLISLSLIWIEEKYWAK